jgi:hypothetical protein
MELLLVSNDRQESRTHNSGLAKGGCLTLKDDTTDNKRTEK